MSDPHGYVEALFDDDADVPPGTGRAWTPALHEAVMVRLRAGSGPGTHTVRKYVGAMHRTPGPYRSGRLTEVRNDREVVEAVDAWAGHGDTDADILEHGISAAVRLYDRERAAAWYAQWRRCRTGRPLRTHRGFFTFMEGGVDDCPDCVRDMELLAGGDFDRACADLLAAGGPAADRPEHEVRLITWVTAQRHPSSRLFTQPALNRVWYVDRFRADVFVFDGRSVTAPPVPVALNPATDVDFVGDAPGCDQLTVAFSGKHNYRAAQRFGRHVLLVAGTYHPSRGQAEMDYSVWLSPATPQEAAGLLADHAASLPRSFRPVPIWWDPRRGSLMRRYSGEVAVGVWGDTWTTGLQGARLDRTFPTEAEAIAALQAKELDWLRSGKVLTNLYLRTPRP